MQIVSAIAIYVIIWWLLFYVVLTFGNRTPDAEGERPRGAEPGAPAVPRLARRVLITTLGAFVILGGVYALLNSGLTLDDIPLPSAPPLNVDSALTGGATTA